MAQTRIPCLMMRGGTSKGAYFLREDLPAEQALLDQVLLAAMGSPDPRQIDGLGGADSLTSKVAIIGRSARPGVDVDYLFAQVSIDQPRVDYGQNCGNILAGVGPFAVERGLVQPTGDVTRVRIYMENTGQTATAVVQTPSGEVRYDGQAHIDGVPGSAAPIVVEFDDIAGSSCGALLPTGHAKDRFDGIEVTCIDNGMPVVLIHAADLGLTGYERPEQLDADDTLKAAIESIRLQAGPLMKLGDVAQRSVPKMCLIAEPVAGGAISSRSFIPHRCHASIGVFAAVSVASACLTEGSVAYELARLQTPVGAGLPAMVAYQTHRLSVEHPIGEFTVALTVDNGSITRCGLLRTARLLFDGQVCIARSVWAGTSAD